jgi:ferritin
MTDRKLSLISPQIGELLVKQIAHELKNFSLYMSYANYFSVDGITDLEEYYRKRAHEELNHHQWIMDYLSDGDYAFIYPAVEQNSEKITSQMVPFGQTVVREIQTTQLLYAIYEASLAEKDYMTASWLYEKLIKEQIEEENTSRMAVTIMEEETRNIFDKAESVLELLES